MKKWFVCISRLLQGSKHVVTLHPAGSHLGILSEAASSCVLRVSSWLAEHGARIILFCKLKLRIKWLINRKYFTFIFLQIFPCSHSYIRPCQCFSAFFGSHARKPAMLKTSFSLKSILERSGNVMFSESTEKAERHCEYFGSKRCNFLIPMCIRQIVCLLKLICVC